MYFELNDVQLALKDSLKRLLQDRYGFEARRLIAANEVGHDQQTWQQMVELGLTGLFVPEIYGGFGSSSVDLLPVMQELGAALSLEPYLPVLMAATAIRLAGNDDQCREILPSVVTGGCRPVWAHYESAGRHAPWWIQTTAQLVEGVWVLDGVKSLVPGAPLADKLVVSARLRGLPIDRSGCGLFLVDTRSNDISVRNFRLVDDTLAGEISLKEVRAHLLGDAIDEKKASAAIDGTLSVGIAAICADMTGAMRAAYKLAVDYLNTRQQFGRLIGQNQALRHRAAEMLVSLELANSMAIAAAVAVDTSNVGHMHLDLHRAKLSVARHARLLALHAIQLHGGIGMTEEYAVGHYLRRIHVLDQLLGDGDAHAIQLAALLSP